MLLLFIQAFDILHYRNHLLFPLAYFNGRFGRRSLLFLPEFRHAEFGHQMEAARKLANKFNSPKEAVQALKDISSEHVRRKAFVLAADIALASGDVDETEEELLEAMQRVLGIDDAMAGKIIEVLALKYAK